VGLPAQESPDQRFGVSVVDPLWEGQVVTGHSYSVDGVGVVKLLSEGKTPADELVEDYSEGVEVGCEGVAASFKYFRSKVMRAP